MMGEFKQELRDGFIEACLHLVNRDFDALAKDFVTLGYVSLLFLLYVSSNKRFVNHVLSLYRLLPSTSDKDVVTTTLTGTMLKLVCLG